MAPKRKAGEAPARRATKRAASGVSTPVSLGSSGSDDDYSDAGDVEEVERVPQRLDSQSITASIRSRLLTR